MPIKKISRKFQAEKSANLLIWRRERDSNPRWNFRPTLA